MKPRYAIFSLILALAWASVLVAATSSCAPSDSARAARATYNEALTHHAEREWDLAAEKFLEARDRAGQDTELRFRAAFNLGLAYAAKADELASGGAPDPAGGAGGNPAQEAIDNLRQSAAWLRSAVPLRPDDEDLRRNLEVVLRRIQVLADQLNQGENSLEKRLDRAIEDQRGLRDSIRGLMARITEASGSDGAGNRGEPLAFRSEFEALATSQRTLSSDVGTISDLAGDELGLLESKAQGDEPQITQEEQVRMIQLQALELYLQKARGNLADARRLLRELRSDRAHMRADTGLRDLKRAREQLLDPVTVLKSAAQDQVQLMLHGNALEQLSKPTIQLPGPAGDTASDSPGDPAASPAAPVAPLWLTTEHLRERQLAIEERTGEVLARFTAVAEQRQNEDAAGDPAATGGDPAGQPPEQTDPKQERMLDAAVEAVPHLQRAVEAMQAASTAIKNDQLVVAVEQQNLALLALITAIERFSEIRDLIELVYREHGETIALLTPPGAPGDGENGQKAGDNAARRDLAALSPEERGKRLSEGIAKNLERLARLEGLFDDELQALEEQASQAAQAAQAGGVDPGGDPGAAQHGAQVEQIEAAMDQYRRAKELRQQAAQSLAELSSAIQGNQAGPDSDPRAIADQGMVHIEELRRLFFSIVEHLKELLRNQTTTHDSTGSASAVFPDDLVAALGPLVDEQKRHALTGEALANALAEQADAAAQSQDAQGQAADAAERMGQAAEEVRAATGQMNEADRLLGEHLEAAGTMSIDFEPTLEVQRLAMEHLENAIRLLEPPQDQQQNQDQQNQDQQQQQEQQQEMSKQQAQRRLQEIRDREAERMRDKKQQQPQTEPVEKDW